MKNSSFRVASSTDLTAIMNDINLVIVVNLQSQNTQLDNPNILVIPTGSLGIWECTEGSMADCHGLVSHPWIYTQHLTGLIHWNLNGGSSSLQPRLKV